MQIITAYRYNPPEVYHVESPEHGLVEVNKHLLRKIFEDEGLSRYFFPQQKMFVHGAPFRPMIANIDLIFWREGAIFTDQHSALLTAGCAVPNELNLQYTIDVFGSNTVTLREHILSHFKVATALCSGDIDFFVLHDNANDINMTDIDEVFKEKSVNRISNYCTKCFIWEREIP